MYQQTYQENTTGIKNYEIPRKYFDSNQMKTDKENYLIANNKAKAPKPKPIEKNANKHIFIDEISKRSSTMPGPWTYSTRNKWLKDDHRVIEVTETKEQQSKRQIWQGIEKDKMNFTTEQKSKTVKSNKEAKRNTFIDKIYQDNQKEKFPKPAPNQYFLDEKETKKFYKEDFKNFVYENKIVKKKSAIPLQSWDLMMKEIVKHSQAVPGPGYTQKIETQKSDKINQHIIYNKFKEIEKSKQEYQKQKEEKQRQFLEQIKEKVKFNIKEQDHPMHTDFWTFDLIQKEIQTLKKPKEFTTFGKQTWFNSNQQERFKKQIELYNQVLNKKLDPKADSQPGPAAYSLICQYKGKLSKKDKENAKKEYGVNYLQNISKGKSISLYYRKID